ncbi:hypothetical protein [Streptomyces yangpuensis]|uniref:hypothetical protein n=1 Tax=Streptomyces yangpuensis TaxID=1648182 RepID=UPI00381F1592
MTPADAREALATARTEAAEAHATVEALAERVREGDDGVTPEQLASQRSLAELAGLRVEAAERKLAQAVTADLDARARTNAAAIRDLVGADDTQPLVDAVQAAAAALAHLTDMAAARAARIHAVASEAVGINAELRAAFPDAGPWPSDAYGVRAQTSPTSVTVVGEGRTAAVPPGRLAAIALALGITGNRGIEADAREALNATTDSLIQNIAREVPGLADALKVSAEDWAGLPEDLRYRLTQQGRNPAKG